MPTIVETVNKLKDIHNIKSRLFKSEFINNSEAINKISVGPPIPSFKK